MSGEILSPSGVIQYSCLTPTTGSSGHWRFAGWPRKARTNGNSLFSCLQKYKHIPYRVKVWW